MKTMRAKALASLLAGFVTLAGVSGCHASSAAMFSESATISASSAPQDSASSTTQISQTSEAGTYVQDDMTELMPQTYAYFTDLRLSADGAVEVVGLSQSGGIQLLRWTDDVWETAVESSQPAVANGALTVAADGTLWTVCAMIAVPTPCRAVRTLPLCKPFRSRLCRKRKRCQSACDLQQTERYF